MNVKECYEQIRGDYEDVKRRFLTDVRIRRFVLLFLKDTSMRELLTAMEEGDFEAAFRAAHSLKGVCLNLGLSGLYEPVNRMTEALRAKNREKASQIQPEVQKEYDLTCECLRMLEQS
jgi:HPt (histidine-containing phosphotransfer) domain-containing protein